MEQSGIMNASEASQKMQGWLNRMEPAERTRVLRSAQRLKELCSHAPFYRDRAAADQDFWFMSAIDYPNLCRTH